MAIEGPLRELGIHDVFQLLDLSRKTGLLRVSSPLLEDEGVVRFENGRVVQATTHKASSLAPSTRASTNGATSRKERERQLRTQIESAIFELMSWEEGFFSFEEQPAEPWPADIHVSISTASLLMEGARRIDEWSRIAQVVPSVAAVPELAPVDAEREGPMLDLLPHEWQVLSIIDGARDVRTLAAELSRDEFEIAKVIFGLTTTGIVVLRSSARQDAASSNTDVEARLSTAHVDAGLAATKRGDFASARASFEQALRLAPDERSAARAQDALNAIAHLERVLEAHVNA
ncbi:MAG: DUF4388 domain-containing protein [Gemmatimonadaceae bacterium]